MYKSIIPMKNIINNINFSFIESSKIFCIKLWNMPRNGWKCIFDWIKHVFIALNFDALCDACTFRDNM